MKDRQDGFTLIELLIAMLVFVISLVLVSDFFTGQLTLFKQQSKITESNIEGVIGLEILRRDIQDAGYGLPWSYQSSIDCSSGGCGEAIDATASAYNDFPANPPRAILTGNGVGFNGSDYLVVKGVSVGMSAASQKWTRLSMTPPSSNTAPGNPRIWDNPSDKLANTDYVTVLSLNGTATNRQLIVNGNIFSTQYQNITSSPWPPADQSETRLVLGVDPDTSLRMPFNRADYFIRRVDSSGNSITPARCAPGTGVLEKVVVSQTDGSFPAASYMPLLDCVADVQVIFGLDMDGDGVIGTYAAVDPDASKTTIVADSPYESEGKAANDVRAVFNDAALLRQYLKEVRVYVLTHEGQRDTSFLFPNSSILVGDSGIGATLGNNFNLAQKIGDPEYKYYRWKLYTIVTKPSNIISR